MKPTLKFSILLFSTFMLLFGAVSCNESPTVQSKEDAPKAEAKAETAKTDAPIVTSNDGSYCFRNENLHEGSDAVDVVDLEMTVKDGFANGTYNWLPAEKDERKGRFRGKMKGNVFKGEYSFSQEGTKETTQIEIILAKDHVIVKAEKAELGLNERVGRVECGEF